MSFKNKSDISTIDGKLLNSVDQFRYLGNNISSTENDVNARIGKAWVAINNLSAMWKSNLTDKLKRQFFQAVVMSVLLYGCTT